MSDAPHVPSSDGAVPRWLRVSSEWALRGLLLLGAIVAAGYVFGYLHVVFLPIILALLLTTLLLPPKRFLAPRGLKPALATALTMLGAILVLAGIGTAIAPAIGNQVSELGDGIQDGVRQMTNVLADEPFNLSRADIDKRVDDALDQLRANSSSISRGLTTGAVLLGEVLTGLIVTLLLTFFFLKDGRKMWEWLLWLLARGRHDEADELGTRIFTALSGYIRGIALVGLFDGVLLGIVLLILSVPLVVPLMILTFFGAFIPLIGAFLAGFAAVLIALVSQGAVAAIVVLVAIIVIQQVEGHLLYPILMSRTVHLHPAVIVLALTAGGVLAGIVGVFLAVPFAATISTIITFVRGGREPEGPVTPEVDDHEPPPAAVKA